MSELHSRPLSIQSVYGLYRDGKLHVNRRYQRKLVWTLVEKQKLIDSILNKYPIPAILLAERPDSSGSYEIIDGLQRLHAILSFIETSFSTNDDRVFDIEHFPTAKAAAEEGIFVASDETRKLTPREVSGILDYELALSTMRGASEAEINEVFDRINTYGHRLSDQERRQAGVQNEFSTLVRQIACTLRGDETTEIVPLRKMPSISIDLPKAKHGYQVQADQVFWVEHGILRASELRDSEDEQCIADIIACIATGELISRSKDSLDEIYTEGSAQQKRVATALSVYGARELADEFKYCVDQITAVCATDGDTKLRQLLFEVTNTNGFPSVFAAILLAFHEIIFLDKKVITNSSGLKKAMRGIARRISSGQKATSPAQRRANIDTVKGLASPHFVSSDKPISVYANHTTADIDAKIRRSEIEAADYELKQGLLTLGPNRTRDASIINKILKTICAIANNGPGRSGHIFIGVADKQADVDRIKTLDGVDGRAVGTRHVVGVTREAAALNISIEQYLEIWKNEIEESQLSAPLKHSVLSSIQYNSYYGLGVIIITIHAQKELSYFEEKIYWRKVDSTCSATKPADIAAIAQRF